MNFNTYHVAADTLRFADPETKIIYTALGVGGEAGEVVDIVKKAVRRGLPIKLSDKERDNLFLELGDVLWYLDALATDLGFTLEDIAKGNIDKLEERHGKKTKRLQKGV